MPKLGAKEKTHTMLKQDIMTNWECINQKKKN